MLSLVAEPVERERESAHDLAMDDLMTAFAAWMRTWNAAATTMDSRLAVLRAAFRDHLGDPATVTADEIGAWLARPEWSAWTRCAYYAHARSFFGWLHESGRRDDNPTARLRAPRSPETRPQPLTADEVDRALAAAGADQRAWLMLGIFAGLRAHEIAKIRGEDVTDDAIYVLGKGGKQAIIPTHPALWELAQSKPRYGYWFPSTISALGHVHPKTISIATTRLFRDLGITGSSHRARHTYGTNLLRGGANIRVVQKLMRHSSLKSTEHYLGVDDGELRQAIESLAA